MISINNKVFYICIFFGITVASCNQYKSSLGPINSEDLYQFRSYLEEVEPRDYAVLSRDISLEFKKNETYTRTYKGDYLVFDENGREKLKEIIFYGPFRKIKGIDAEIYSMEGDLIKRITRDDLTDLPVSNVISDFSDVRFKELIISENTFPYILRVKYTVEFENFFFWNFWYPQKKGEFIKKSLFSISYPEEMDVNIRENEVSKLNTNHTKVSGKFKHTWESKDLTPEDYPFNSEPFVLVQPVEFSLDGVAGSFEDWKSFGFWYYKLNQGRQELNDETKAKLDLINAQTNDYEEKIKKVYELLQSQTRYISIQLGAGGWKTFPASFVEQKGYGDCKALTNFSFSMFEYLGIKTFPVLLNSGYQKPDLITDFPSTQFNHIVLTIPTEEENIWLECTSQIFPFNYIGSPNANRYGLMISEEGGELIRTPNYGKEVNYTVSKTIIDLLPEGYSNIKREIESGGVFLEDYYYGLVGETEENRVRWIDSYLPVNLISYKSIDTKSADRKENPVIVAYEALSDDLVRESGSRKFIKTHGLASKQSFATVDFIEENGTFFGFTEIDSTVINIPENYFVERIPESVKIENEFGVFRLDVILPINENKLEIKREFILKKRIGLEDEEEKRFLERIKIFDRREIVLKKESPE